MVGTGIYQIVNQVTQKRYIGLASNLNSRKQGHIYDLRRGKHGNKYLQKAWDKYGEINFKFNCIEECSIEDLHKREDYWVKVLNVLDRYYGYNLKPTDPNGCSILSEETRAKISATHKTKGIRPSTLCIANRKKVNMSPEGRANQIISLKKIDFNEVNKAKRKTVIDTATNQIYDSLTIAAEALGMTKHKLSKYLLGTRTNKTTFKYL